MLNHLVECYRFLFARRVFTRFNKALYHCSLRGLGLLNYETDIISGERNFLKRVISKITSPVVIDVGANIGNYAKTVLEVNPSAIVYAFEPHPLTFKKLQQNCRNNRITVINSGVGHTNEVLTLFDYAYKEGSPYATLYKDAIEQKNSSSIVEYRVSITTLSDFASKYNIDKVDLLKVDTEGNELNVLNGFIEHINAGKVKYLQFEFNEKNVASRTFFKDIWDILPNYDIYRMLPDGLLPIQHYKPLYCEIFAYQNLVAILKNIPVGM